MKIVWDERKRLANLEKHAMHFADITVDFFWTAKAFPVRTGRLMAVGLTKASRRRSFSGRLELKVFRSFPCGPPA
jgi:uncharacterized DUF497 family protein